mmetsp:Transcript_18290/g.29146  ORF Transcript_18290/g.29146 Transcript_18290/m.29146 type:complete len:288 (-) Transcript_18290:121-984(-)
MRKQRKSPGRPGKARNAKSSDYSSPTCYLETKIPKTLQNQTRPTQVPLSIPKKNKTSETNELPEDNRVVVFDLYILLIHRFGYGDKMIRKARKFYMEEYKDENKSLGLRMVPWYHGVLNDRQVVEIMKKKENVNKFLLREKLVNDSKQLAIEFSKPTKGQELNHKKKKLIISPRGYHWFVNKKSSGQSGEAEALSRAATEKKVKNVLRRKAESIEILHDKIIQACIGPATTELRTVATIQEAVREMSRRSSDNKEREPILPKNYMKQYSFIKKTAQVELETLRSYYS